MILKCQVNMGFTEKVLIHIFDKKNKNLCIDKIITQQISIQISWEMSYS